MTDLTRVFKYLQSKNIQNVDTSVWMHDIVHSDFTPYDPDEIAVLRRYNLGESS